MNLSQLTLALQNYQNTHDVYPPGVVNATGPVQNVPSGYHHGWLVQILPYLDRGDFDGMIDDTAGIYAPANLQARKTVLASLVCPSDVGPLRRADGVADNNYAGCHHDNEAPINTNQNGVLYLNSRVRYDDIPDGSATPSSSARNAGSVSTWAGPRGRGPACGIPGTGSTPWTMRTRPRRSASSKKKARTPRPPRTRSPTTRSGSADSAAATPASSALPSATDRRCASWIVFLPGFSGFWSTGMMESYLKAIYGELNR